MGETCRCFWGVWWREEPIVTRRQQGSHGCPTLESQRVGASVLIGARAWRAMAGGVLERRTYYEKHYVVNRRDSELV